MLFIELAEQSDKFIFNKSTGLEVNSLSGALSSIKASLYLKKEVWIGKDSNFVPIKLTKGCHFKFEDDFIYINPSIKSKFKSINPDDFSFPLNYENLSKALQIVLDNQ